MRYLVLVVGLGLTSLAAGVWATVGDPSGTPVPEIGFVGCALVALSLAAIRKAGPRGYALALVAGATCGAALGFFGKAFNVRNLEARTWAGLPGNDGSSEWNQYLYSMGGALDASRFRPQLAEDLQKVLEATPIGSKTHDAFDHLSNRMQSSSRSGDPWFLQTFTPVAAHVEQAMTKYAQARYREVMADKEVGELRAYRLEFKGEHTDETTAALRAKYVQALVRYDAAVAGQKTDPEAVAGMRALLLNGDVDLAGIALVFRPVAGIEARELEDVLIKKLGVREVFPVGPSFTQERSAARRNSLLLALNQALQPIAGELFALTTEATGASADRFEVTQRVFPSGSVYASREDTQKPLSERTVAIGIAMKLECAVVVGGRADHVFSLTVKPAAEISTTKIEADPVYASMANSAYDAFEQALLHAYGF